MLYLINPLIKVDTGQNGRGAEEVHLLLSVFHPPPAISGHPYSCFQPGFLCYLAI